MNFWVILSTSVALVSIVLYHLLSANTSLRDLKWLSSSISSSEVADLLVYNGILYTGDPSLLFADSMAIRDGRILRVGNYSFVQESTGDRTRVLNLQGKLVTSGFIDSHVHLIFGGLQMIRVQLRDVSSKEQFINKVKDAIAGTKSGSWILGGGWNNDLWDGKLPEASWIDDITPENPVWLSRMDGHMGLANSVALQIAGISDSTKDPAGGIIMRQSSGEPTGLLIDSAMELVLPHIPEVSVDERRKALVKATHLALKRGVTTVVDFGRYFPGASVEHPWEDLSDVYGWADLSGNLQIRVCLFFPIDTWSRLHGLIKEKGKKLSEWIYLGGVKAFSDGSLGSNSALFHEPYLNEPQNYGLQVRDFGELFNLTVASDRSGLQVAIHAIGDKAVDLILDMYKLVASPNEIRDRRLRIEHAQHLAPGTADRFRRGKVVASVQPDHLLYDADPAIKKLGVERAQKGSYLFQSLLDSGALLAFGSDWPVADINPLSNIRTSMKRIPYGWTSSWNPSQQIKLTDALNSHTISAAHACFLEEELGSLSPGKLADFVVLSTDSWEEFSKDGSASVVATFVGGQQAYP
ncbi:protein LONG AFTER FAR-RED 3 [Impatiens glandulifera]|uniref:protein LONG AFTER FAR-RED 3 n=1 Tax=Impatiens glandulifera TaxID=253017 RepID=UPI001FB0EEAB|nr:protein LONG AFTER FAR-RED 3 [Impatiens glandulifera]